MLKVIACFLAQQSCVGYVLTYTAARERRVLSPTAVFSSHLHASHIIDNTPMSCPLEPVGSHVLVRLKEKKTESAGGVVLLEESVERPREGTVMSIGPGLKTYEAGFDMPIPCNIGETVVFGEFAGTAVSYDNAHHQLIKDEDIMFVYSGEKPNPDSMRMIGDQVLLEGDKTQHKTDGGILLPDLKDSRPKLTTGIARAVGPGRTTEKGDLLPMAVTVGTRVKYHKFAGEDMKIDGKLYKVLHDSDLMIAW